MMPSLSSHPIFQIEQTEYSHFKEDSRRNVVAFKGTEVYVAVGSTVRCAELRDDSLGEDSTDKKPYQVFTRLFLPSNIFMFSDTAIPECDVPNQRDSMESLWHTFSPCGKS